MIGDFAKWLKDQFETRGWTQNELARKAGTTSGHVSLVMSGLRQPGPELCRGVARALGIPEIVVFVQAGLMSQTANPDELTLRELYGLLSELPPDDQRAILAEARARFEAAPSVRTELDPAAS